MRQRIGNPQIQSGYGYLFCWYSSSLTIHVHGDLWMIWKPWNKALGPLCLWLNYQYLHVYFCSDIKPNHIINFRMVVATADQINKILYWNCNAMKLWNMPTFGKCQGGQLAPWSNLIIYARLPVNGCVTLVPHLSPFHGNVKIIRVSSCGSVLPFQNKMPKWSWVPMRHVHDFEQEHSSLYDP